jgi:hypothetical protein
MNGRSNRRRQPTGRVEGGFLALPWDVLWALRISAHRDRRFRDRDRTFRLIVTDRFGIVTGRFGDRDRAKTVPVVGALGAAQIN